MKTTRRNIFSPLKDAFKMGLLTSAIVLPGIVMAQTGSANDPLIIREAPSANIVIDGVGNEPEWSQVVAQPIAVEQRNFCGSNPACFKRSGDADASGTVKVMWKGDALYALFEITDDVFSEGQGTYQRDCNEIILDLDNSKSPKAYDENDYQFIIASDGVTEDKNFGSALGANALVTKTGGYTNEVKITWPIDFIANFGAKIGIDFAINDGDVDGATREAKMSWFSSDNNIYQWPSLAGTAVLGDPLVGTLSKYVTSSLLYPNPANAGQAKIDMNLDAAQNVKITLTDLVGKQVAVLVDANTNSLATSFNTSLYPKGMYTVNYYINGKAAGSKLFVIE